MLPLLTFDGQPFHLPVGLGFRDAVEPPDADDRLRGVELGPEEVEKVDPELSGRLVVARLERTQELRRTLKQRSQY